MKKLIVGLAVGLSLFAGSASSSSELLTLKCENSKFISSLGNSDIISTGTIFIKYIEASPANPDAPLVMAYGEGFGATISNGDLIKIDSDSFDGVVMTNHHGKMASVMTIASRGVASVSIKIPGYSSDVMRSSTCYAI